MYLGMNPFSCLDVLRLQISPEHSIKTGVKRSVCLPQADFHFHINCSLEVCLAQPSLSSLPLPSPPEWTQMRNAITLEIPMSPFPRNFTKTLLCAFYCNLLGSWIQIIGSGLGPAEGQTRTVLRCTHPYY